jgi:hypothetical protein
VLAAAHSIVTAEARTPHSVARRSLFDLPLGHGAIWTITEEEVETKASDGREEVVTSVLPAWSAETTVDLDREDLGLPTAARVIKQALGLTNLTYEARQRAVARYSAVGFEAAAVTGSPSHVVRTPAPSRATAGRPPCASGTPSPWSPWPATTSESRRATVCRAPGTGCPCSRPG